MEQSNKVSDEEMVKQLWYWAIAIVFVIVTGSAWILFSRSITGIVLPGTANTELEPAPVAGHPAPNFELATLDGEVVNLADLKGRPVLVNFWATWCGPCRAEMPEFQAASVDNADDLIVLGVNNTVSDTPAYVGDFVQELGLTFPILLDEDGSTAEAYRVRGLPMTVFIDRNGVVNEVFTGPINKAYIESKIPEL